MDTLQLGYADFLAKPLILYDRIIPDQKKSCKKKLNVKNQFPILLYVFCMCCAIIWNHRYESKYTKEGSMEL